MSVADRIDICISTLWGEILSLKVDPNTLVGDLKQQCMAARPSPQLPVSVDLSKIMLDDLEIQNLGHDDGVRLGCRHRGIFDDGQTIGSLMDYPIQLGEDPDEDDGRDLFLVKMVFMKFKYMNVKEKMWTRWIQNGDANHVDHFGAVSHQQWIVLGWGRGDGRSDVLGIYYQHKATEDHCLLARKGVDPRIESRPLSVRGKRSRSLSVDRKKSWTYFL